MRRLYTTLAVAASCLVQNLSAQPLRVLLNPSNIRLLDDPDYYTWTVEAGGQSSSTSIGDDGAVSLELAAPGGSALDGNYNKITYTRFVSHLGERVVGEGVSTSNDAPGPLTLSISGLEAGEHTLLTWHNSWDNLDSAAVVSVAVNGQEVATVNPSLPPDADLSSAMLNPVTGRGPIHSHGQYLGICDFVHHVFSRLRGSVCGRRIHSRGW